MSKDKLVPIPFQKRIFFRVQGADTATVFCEEFYDLVAKDDRYSDLRMFKLDCNQEVPKY
ncbi:hypothetical protein BCT42_04235 [Vibrio lentus]|nr:hypothetical protein BCT75_17790 [Vibrio lentus]PMN07659.1 hypothetical protein BCT42_04235 [Vibrio lentus]